jgi:hypothetical protein
MCDSILRKTVIVIVIDLAGSIFYLLKNIHRFTKEPVQLTSSSAHQLFT